MNMQAPKLISVAGGTAGTTLEISPEKFSIGRALHNSYIIEDVLISRQHCTLECIDGQWTVLDTSVNGTYLNNVIIGRNNRKNLEHGDIIMLTNNVKFKFEVGEILPEDDGFIAVADAVMETADIAEHLIMSENTPEVLTENTPEVPLNKKEEPSSSSKLEEEDLTCSVCAELFINAVTLGCSHTFCKFCIEQWKKNDDVCPICRTKIKGQFPTLIINNLVEKYLPEISKEDRARRKQLIEDREKLQPSNAITPANASATTTIDITSEDDEYDADSVFEFDGSVLLLPDDWEDEYDDDDYSDYNGLPGAYYGGYGSCYSCGDRGHWANGCPANPRRRRN